MRGPLAPLSSAYDSNTYYNYSYCIKAYAIVLHDTRTTCICTLISGDAHTHISGGNKGARVPWPLLDLRSLHICNRKSLQLSKGDPLATFSSFLCQCMTHTHTQTHKNRTHKCIPINTHACINIHTCTHARTRARARAHTHAHAHTHTHTHTHMHPHAHKHAHTRTCTRQWRL